MIIYNVTVNVENEIAEQWLKWLKEVHVSEVVGTGCFTNARILKLCDTNEAEGVTYTVQYAANTLRDYENYLEKYANEMRQKAFDKWGNRFIAFRTVMEVIH